MPGLASFSWAGVEQKLMPRRIRGRITRAENLDVEEPQIVGMAGAWDLEDAGGGLCAY